jgi:hypothetical protein
LETISGERHVVNVSVENDQGEPSHSDEDIKVIETKAYRSVTVISEYRTIIFYIPVRIPYPSQLSSSSILV